MSELPFTLISWRPDGQIPCSACARNKVDGYHETGTNRVLPPAMALDVASSYLLSKARMNLAEKEMERMKDKASSAELLGQLADVLKRGEEDS